MNEDFVGFDLAKKLKEKGFNQPCLAHYTNGKFEYNIAYCDKVTLHDLYENWGNGSGCFVDAPTISQVLKWLREEKNIDVEIHAEAGMLGNKVYVPFISTYTEFTFATSPDIVRYRQKKFNPTRTLPHEIVPAHVYFNEWEEAAIAGIEYVIDNLI